MSPHFSPEELVGAFRDAALLLTSEGDVVAMNVAAQALLGPLPHPALPQPLGALLDDPEQRLPRALHTWTRSRQPTPASLAFRNAAGTLLPCRCTGVLLRPGHADAPALVLLRLQPSGAAPSNFALLTQKIDELNREIRARQQAEERLRLLNVRLEEKVAGRTEALRAANDQLRARNRELQEFASVASHDLQEPLRKVMTFADLLGQHLGPTLDEEGRGYLMRIERAAGRMSGLIRALLTLSQVSTQGQSLQQLDLNLVMDEVLSDLEARIGSSAGEVRVVPLPALHADALQMRQLFQNLIANGLKFHRPGIPPCVSVTAEVEGTDGASQTCVLTFEDNGVGFDEQYRDRLFRPFQRLHDRATYEGTGMGLAICRRIVERHGGSIEAQGRPGRGSRFVVRLPVQQRKVAVVGAEDEA